MISRLLAFFMALMIGSPACWCCTLVPAAETVSVEVCCHHTAATQAESPSEKGSEKCPCETSLLKRDVSLAHVAVPSVDWLSLESSIWDLHLLIPTIDEGEKAVAFHRIETAPMKVPVPLYQEHCALLL